VCDTKKGYCVDCVTSDDCPATSFCSPGGQCLPDLCSGPACANGALYQCNTDGSGFDGGKICTDSNACTDDECIPAKGCLFFASTKPCDDANACTTNDACKDGSCQGGVELACDDGNPCTDDACDPVTGCTHSANKAPCDDGLFCTGGDVCADKACKGGPSDTCDDANPCTVDSCVSASSACTHTPLPKDPNAVEFVGDKLDNNCDGQTDEPTAPCDAVVSSGSDADYAKAIDLCAGVSSSVFAVSPSSYARAVRANFAASNPPQHGSSLAVISTGTAMLPGEPNYAAPQQGTNWQKESSYPGDTGGSCGGSGKVLDFTDWKLSVVVPSNAKSFSVDVNVFSAEYPEYLQDQYSDTFLLLFESQKMKRNIAQDFAGKCFFTNAMTYSVCPGCPKTAAGLAGTGYDQPAGQGNQLAGGSTGWQTISAPVTPGETITLRFIIFDRGDGIFDTAALIDNFRWSPAVLAEPITVQK